MSSITMAADSTQDEHLQRSKKKSSKQTRRRYQSSSNSLSVHSNDSQIKKKKVKKETKMNSSDSYFESDLDLSKEVLPISGYQNNKEAMIENMFKSISSKKLKTMLPEILQALSMKELKSLCLKQLHLMSDKRVMKIFEGIDPSEISSSGSEEGIYDKATTNERETHESKLKEMEYEGSEKVDVLVNFFNSGTFLGPQHGSSFILNSTKFLVKKETDEFSCNAVKSSSIGNGSLNRDGSVSLSSNGDKDSLNPSHNNDTGHREYHDNGKKCRASLSKTQLEILELEMRARAIKAMLKAQDEHDKDMESKFTSRETYSSDDEKWQNCKELSDFDLESTALRLPEYRTAVTQFTEDMTLLVCADGRSHERTSCRKMYLDDSKRN